MIANLGTWMPEFRSGIFFYSTGDAGHGNGAGDKVFLRPEATF